MYGGVATPLALLHGEMNGRTKQYNAIQTRPSPRDDSYSHSAIRLPPLRETSHREHTPTNCENEPLLPSPAPKPNKNCKRTNHEESLPPPPLPPHKNSYQQVCFVANIGDGLFYMFLKGTKATRLEIHSSLAKRTKPLLNGQQYAPRSSQAILEATTKAPRKGISE